MDTQLCSTELSCQSAFPDTVILKTDTQHRVCGVDEATRAELLCPTGLLPLLQCESGCDCGGSKACCATAMLTRFALLSITVCLYSRIGDTLIIKQLRVLISNYCAHRIFRVCFSGDNGQAIVVGQCGQPSARCHPR